MNCLRLAVLHLSRTMPDSVTIGLPEQGTAFSIVKLEWRSRHPESRKF
jgi:hypothetical protein